MKTANTIIVAAVLLLDAASSFQSRPTFAVGRSSVVTASDDTQREQLTCLYNSVNLVDVVLPGILFAGAVAATMMKDEATTIQLPDFNSKKSPTAVKNEPMVAVATPVPVMQEAVVAVKKPEPTVKSAPTPTKAAPAVVVASQPEPAALTPSAPPAAAVSVAVPAAAAATKPVLTVVDVASTVAEQRATRELVEQKKRQQQQQEAQAQSAAVAEAVTMATVVETAPVATKGKKRKMVLRMMKKVVAPWRKWESIA